MTLKLEAKGRELVGKKIFQLRKQDLIPAVLYGNKVKNENLSVSYSEFEKIFSEAGESTIIDLKIDGGKTVKTIVADIQRDPVKNRIIHVDFHEIKMDEEINANIPINFVGDSRLIKEEGGSLVHSISEVEIRCLPGDLIHEIEVDISVLNDFDDVIAIKDLKLPKGVEITGHEDDDVVCLMVKPKHEEEAPVEAAPVEAEVKKEEEKK